MWVPASVGRLFQAIAPPNSPHLLHPPSAYIRKLFSATSQTPLSGGRNGKKKQNPPQQYVTRRWQGMRVSNPAVFAVLENFPPPRHSSSCRNTLRPDNIGARSIKREPVERLQNARDYAEILSGKIVRECERHRHINNTRGRNTIESPKRS